MLSVSGSGQRVGAKPLHSAYGTWEGGDGGNEGKPSPHASGESFFISICLLAYVFAVPS